MIKAEADKKINLAMEEILNHLRGLEGKQTEIEQLSQIDKTNQVFLQHISDLEQQLLHCKEEAEVPYQFCEYLNSSVEEIMRLHKDPHLRAMLRDTPLIIQLQSFLRVARGVFEAIPAGAKWLAESAFEINNIALFREAIAAWDGRNLPQNAETFSALQHYYQLLQQKADQARAAAIAEITACEALSNLMQERQEQGKVIPLEQQQKMLQAFQKMYVINAIAGLAEEAAIAAQITLDELANTILAQANPPL